MENWPFEGQGVLFFAANGVTKTNLTQISEITIYFSKL